MDKRKVIKFGQNSFVISLPKEWVDSHKLEKGDEVHVEKNALNLIVSPHKRYKVEKEKKILADNKTFEEIEQEIISAYKSFFSTIIIEGKDLKPMTKKIKRLLQELSGVEIIQNSMKQIVAKDLLDLNHISISTMINRMDMMVRNMFTEVLDRDIEEIDRNRGSEKDQDINRLNFLVSRVARAILKNPTSSSEIEDPMTAYHQEKIAWGLERTGDHIKRIIRKIYDMHHKEDISKEIEKEYMKLFKEAKENYVEIIKAYYNKDKDKALKMLVKTKNLLQKTRVKHVEEGWIEEVSVRENFKNFYRDIRVLIRAIVERGKKEETAQNQS